MLTLTTTRKEFSIEGLPAGWNYIDRNSFYISTSRPRDTFVQAVLLEVCGCQVQINRYDYDDNDILVFIRQPGAVVARVSPKLGKSEIEDYIRNNT